MLSYENVKLWFARNEDDELVTVNDITKKESKKHRYYCPVCGSDLKPKAIESARVAPHFAHVDASKCSSETMIHWWFKHRFLEVGDEFTVASDEENIYKVKEIQVEEPHDTSNGIYRPDMTIITEDDNVIYFEFNYSNKKKIKDYLDMWLELKSIVVEVDIKQLMLQNEIPEFRALFYDGKVFNAKRNDTYYNTIGRYKEEKMRGKVNDELKERIKKLDWFWDDVLRYKKDEVNINYMYNVINSISRRDKYIVEEILNKSICSHLLEDYKKYEAKEWVYPIENFITDKYGEHYLDYIDYNFDERRLSVYRCHNHKREYLNMNFYTPEKAIEVIREIIDVNIDVEKYRNSVSLYGEISTSIKKRLSNRKKYKEIVNYFKDNYNFDFYYYIDYKKMYLSNIDDYAIRSKASFDMNVDFILETDDYDQFTYTVAIDDYEETDFNLLCENVFENTLRYSDTVRKSSHFKIIDDLCRQLNARYLEVDVANVSRCFDYVSKGESSDYYVISLFLDDDLTEVDYIPYRIKVFDILSKTLEDSYRSLSSRIDKDIERNIARECVQCNESFSMSVGEIIFFNKKGFKLPKRCKSCRKKRK